MPLIIRPWYYPIAASVINVIILFLLCCVGRALNIEVYGI